MTYADTDFFLALIKDDDWLKSRARTLLSEHEGTLRTSLATMIELLLLASRYELDPERIVVSACQIAELRDVDPHVVLLAARFMRDDKLTTFDAVHAAFCMRSGEAILSSDHVFDRVGVRRVPLEDGDKKKSVA